nr:hypothetical protein GCM10025732_58380 [Glycomyces mayteni]
MTNRYPFPLRWNDNDQYGHMNNTVYYEAMDSGVNTWMMRRAGLDPAGEVIGLARASSCEFLAPASFPDVLEVDIAVARLGTTSITWDLAILREGAPTGGRRSRWGGSRTCSRTAPAAARCRCPRRSAPPWRRSCGSAGPPAKACTSAPVRV